MSYPKFRTAIKAFFCQVLGITDHLGMSHWAEVGYHKWKLFLIIFCFYIGLVHVTGLLRPQGSQKNWKRPTKVMKSNSKARYYQKSEFNIFFACLESFGNNWLEFNFDLNSKVIKAKKATINGQSCKSKSHYFFCPNLVFPHY